MWNDTMAARDMYQVYEMNDDWLIKKAESTFQNPTIWTTHSATWRNYMYDIISCLYKTSSCLKPYEKRWSY